MAPRTRQEQAFDAGRHSVATYGRARSGFCWRGVGAGFGEGSVVREVASWQRLPAWGKVVPADRGSGAALMFLGALSPPLLDNPGASWFSLLCTSIRPSRRGRHSLVSLSFQRPAVDSLLPLVFLSCLALDSIFIRSNTAVGWKSNTNPAASAACPPLSTWTASLLSHSRFLVVISGCIQYWRWPCLGSAR